jgi:uncharacterized phage-like protein YoqJ
MAEMHGNTEKGKAACFTGHRRIGKADLPVLKQLLDETIETLVQQGISTFLCGGAVGFDALACRAVDDLRAKSVGVRDNVKLVMVLPCRNQSKGWSTKDKAVYGELLTAADEVVYVSEEYFDGCMKLRNARLVEDSDICVAYLKNVTRSGTAQTVRMAKEKGIPVINLAENDNSEGRTNL